MKIAYLINRRVPVAVVKWHPAMEFAFGAIDAVFYAFTAEDALMTAAQEAAHKQGSRHYGLLGSHDPDIRCRAADFSTKKVKEEWQRRMDQVLQERLGSDFLILWERHKQGRKSGQLHHLHVAFKPKPVYVTED